MKENFSPTYTQVVSTLTSDQYKDHIDLKATIALVDPRNLLDEKYTSNQNFVDQLDSADIIVANKADECSEEVIKHFEAWAQKRETLSEYVVTSLGKINLSPLDTDKHPTQPVEPKHSSSHSHSHHHAILKLPQDDGFSENCLVFRQDIDWKI
jgi:G3E family GTPase